MGVTLYSCITPIAQMSRKSCYLRATASGCWLLFSINQPRRHGGFGGLSHPQTKLQAPPNWNMKHYKLVEFLSNLNVKSPLNERTAPLLTTFWRRFWYQSMLPLGSALLISDCCILHHQTTSSFFATVSYKVNACTNLTKRQYPRWIRNRVEYRH